ncbi:MAG: ETC complex I subunit [Hyphomicrobiales bacterium]|nr:ETC complex I subunit [Hyphomicrobiales bacterium]MDE2018113.1 ETC complex I subunit [Hyphomicrobiales bacterium]
MTARIYRPGKSATQSGKARAKDWRLDFAPESAKSVEPLMGWTSSSDMRQQVRIDFATKEEAIAYAVRKGIDYRVEEAQEPSPKTLSYSDNFRVGRVGQWTH